MSAERVRPLRSLADDLRSRSDACLADVIRLRPDIAEPVPADIAELAARASSLPSIRRAIDELDRRTIGVLAAMSIAEQPVTPAELPEAVSAPGQLLEIVTGLWQRALLWGPEPESLDIPLHVMTAAREAAGPPPPRPVDLAVTAPLPERTMDPAAADQMGGQHALAAISVIAGLADSWAAKPPAVLKTGGLGVREFAAAAAELRVDELTAAFWVELGFISGLIAEAELGSRNYAPTLSYDGWLAAELPDQWARLAIAWFATERDSSRVGALSADHQRITALSRDLETPGLARLRRSILAVLRDAGPGAVLGAEGVDEVLAQQLPRVRPLARARAVSTVLSQAELLGVTAGGSLTSLGRALLAAPRAHEQVAAAARAVMPAPTDEFLAQADLTLVVPGPPSPALRNLLGLAADLESTGGAAVYRVTPASVARILDSGHTPAEVLEELAARSITPLPQPLEYLINDVARRHGAVRIGAVDSYIRSEDEAVITALLAHPRAGAIGLSQVSPTVLVSRAPAQTLLEIARDLGHAPLAEGSDGSVVSVPRIHHRAPDAVTPAARGTGFDDVFVKALVRALRNTQEQSNVAQEPGSSLGPLPRMATAQSVTVLRAALEQGYPIWIGYADNAGSTTRRLVDVVAFDAGAISAFDHNSGRIRTLALSRVTGVERADPAATLNADARNAEAGEDL